MDQKPELLLQASRFRVVRMSRRLADGTSHAREVVQHPGSVVILPLLADGRVCLIRNFRVAVSQTLLELPAGTIDSGEDPAETARRELQEETGYCAGRWEKLAEFFVSPGITDERMHLFRATELSPGPPQREATEEIQTELLNLTEALRLAETNQIHDAKTLVALLLHSRNCRAEP